MYIEEDVSSKAESHDEQDHIPDEDPKNPHGD